MKKVKMNLGVLALVLGGAIAFAFNLPENKPTEVRAVEWFSYNGGGISDPQNYTKLTGEPECVGDGALCAIEAPEAGMTGKPTQDGVNNPDDTRNHP